MTDTSFRRLQPTLPSGQSAATVAWSSLALAIVLVASKLQLWRGLDMGRLLWAEDGRIFLKHAIEHGAGSVFLPYEGYFHLYPRVVAWVAALLPLRFAAAAFFLGWFLAFLLMVWVLWQRMSRRGLRSWACVAAIALVVAQPHSGEVFFTLTNAQWSLGVALAVLLLVPAEASRAASATRWELFLIAAMCLTGPFVVLYAPLYVLQVVAQRRLRCAWPVLVIVLAAGAVQLACLSTASHRFNEAASPVLGDWAIALQRFVLFGNVTAPGLVVAFVFEGLLVCSLWRSVTRAHTASAGYLIGAACVVFAASLYALRASPAVLDPMGAGARYYFIPYSLVLYAAALAASKLSFSRFVATLLAAAVVCLLAWHHARTSWFGVASRPVQSTQEDLVSAQKSNHRLIRMNPSAEWDFRLNGPSVDPALSELRIDSNFTVLNAQRSGSREGAIFNSVHGDPQLVAAVDGLCAPGQRLGLEIDFRIDAPGMAQLFWSNDGLFSAVNSATRQFAPGRVLLEFDLPIHPAPRFIRLDPRESAGSFELLSTKGFCFEK